MAHMCTHCGLVNHFFECNHCFLDNGFEEKGSFIIESDKGWREANEKEAEACESLKRGFPVDSLPAEKKEGEWRGYEYIIDKNGFIWLEIDDVYREIREIFPARRPPE